MNCKRNFSWPSIPDLQRYPGNLYVIKNVEDVVARSSRFKNINSNFCSRDQSTIKNQSSKL